MTIVNHLKEIVKEKHLRIDINESDLNKPFKDLGLDSLDVFDVIVNLEKRLNIQLPDETLMKLKSINDLIEEVNKIVPNK